MSIFVEKFLAPYMIRYRKSFFLWLKHRKKHLKESKVFDTINYDLLIAKLHARGFTYKSLRLVKAILEIVGREQKSIQDLVADLICL